MVFSGNDEEDNSGAPGEQAGVVPLLPLRDIVVFPHMVVPLFVGRPKSIQALEDAMAGSRELMLSAQRQAGQEEPSAEDIYSVGTLGSIIQLLRLPDGTVKVLVEGKSRARIRSFQSNAPYFSVRLDELPDPEGTSSEAEGLVRTVHATFESYSKLNKKAPAELLTTISAIEEPGKLADSIVVHLNLKLEERQSLLEMLDPLERLEDVYSRMQAEIEVLEVERKIRSRVKKEDR
jgi:ATP-dependent Lon protease